MAADFWLIKSAGRVIGPLSTDEVISGLRAKEFFPLDEVSMPFGRWHYIRDQKSFELICNELRNRKQTSETTFTETGADNTATDITERVSAFGAADRLTANIEDQLKESRKEASHTEVETKVYGYSKDKEFREKIQTESKANYFIYAALAVVVIGLTLKMTGSMNLLKIRESREVLIQKAQLNGLLANYSESARLYKQALDESRDPQTVLELSLALLASNQNTELKHLLDKEIDNNLPQREKTKALNAMSVVSFLDSEYARSRKFAEQALELDSTDTNAMYNLAVLNFHEQQYIPAAKQLYAVLEIGMKDAAVPVLMGLTSYLAHKHDGNSEFVSKAKAALLSHASAFDNYRIEALAILLTMAIDEKNKEEALKYANLILNSDPFMTEEIRKSATYIRKPIELSSLKEYLKKLNLEDLPPRVIAAIGYLMFIGTDKTEGKRLIEEMNSKDPNDLLVRAILSYVQDEMGREEESIAGLTIALEDSNIKFPHFIRARQCLKKKDYLCAELQWTSLLGKDENSLSAIGGLAWVFINKGMASESRKLVLKGLNMNPDYLPFVKADLKLKGLLQDEK